MDGERDRLLTYYQAELRDLRERGVEFADRFPKIAARLQLATDESRDPHVERLIEAFAFLTARLRMKLDGSYPDLAASLLEAIEPEALAPTPALSVARFDLDPARASQLDGGFEIPKHSRLFAATVGGPPTPGAPSRDSFTVRFRTAYPVTLWPVTVEGVFVERTTSHPFLAVDARDELWDAPREVRDRLGKVTDLIRIRLRSVGGLLTDPPSLRFYLGGDRGSAFELYDLLVGDLVGVAVALAHREDDLTPRILPPSSLRPVGFRAEERLTPEEGYGHPAHSLLREYFAFPRKFLFFDLVDFNPSPPHDSTPWGALDVILMLGRRPPPAVQIDRGRFQLGCTPVVNIFRQTSEPIRVDHRRASYRLSPDARRERWTEIHSIRYVSFVPDDADYSRTVRPYYSREHALDTGEHMVYWHARRVPTVLPHAAGTDIELTFVDDSFDPARPPEDTAYAHLWCTNRDLAEQLRAGEELVLQGEAPHGRVTLLHDPSLPIYPPADGSTRWRLVSRFSLGHHSLLPPLGSTEGDGGLTACDPEPLHEILSVHAPADDPAAERQIQGLVEMQARGLVRIISIDPRTASSSGGGPVAPWRGHVSGREVRIKLDKQRFVEASALLFASVIRHFLAQYSATNSFVEVVAFGTHLKEDEWKRWPPMAGTRQLL